MCLATIAYLYCSMHIHVYMLLILVLAVNSDCFQILRSYTLLLKLPIFMQSWQEQLTEHVMLVLVKLQHGKTVENL